MWCDDFDMDLPKVIPGARNILGSLADTTVWTYGHLTDGKLNHPTVWNDAIGMVAYFGFRNPCKPEGCWTRDPLVRCTLWEAFRDLWVHGCVMVLEGRPVLDTHALWPQFQELMGDLRGWRTLSPSARSWQRRVVRRALVDAVGRIAILDFERRASLVQSAEGKNDD
jgi:hypothetical protein